MANMVIDNDAPTLDDVNQNLLRKLNDAIQAIDVDGDPERLLSITEAVAKLNSSSKNNDRLNQPLSEKEKVDAQVAGMFSRLGEAEIIGKEH